MLDLVAIVSLGLFFGLSVLYIRGCDHLKGPRP